MKLIGENKMKVTERKLREIIRAEIQNLTEGPARSQKGSTGKSIGFSGAGVQSTSRSKGRTKFSGRPSDRSAPSGRSPFKRASRVQRGGVGGTRPTYPAGRARGGATEVAARSAQGNWIRGEQARIDFGLAKARELRSAADSEYWSLESEKFDVLQDIWDLKWLYANAIVTDNTSEQSDSLGRIVAGAAEVQEFRTAQGRLDIDWSRYEARRR